MLGAGEATAGQQASCTTNSEIWQTKNLYMTFWNEGRILAIRPSALAKTDRVDSVIEEADIFGNWDITNHHPIGMGVLAEDSKVFMMGGHRNHCNKLQDYHSESCTLNSSIHNQVYELDITTTLDDGSLTLRPSSSIPELPRPLPSPIVVKIKGKTYLMYGEENYIKWGHPPFTRSEPNSFWVLRKKNKDKGKKKKEEMKGVKRVYEWFSLPPPPFYIEDKLHRKWFIGVIGNQLCVKSGGKLHLFDVVEKQWGVPCCNTSWNHVSQSITLSIPRLKEPHSVVIYTDLAFESVDLYAALVDGKANASHIQFITNEMPDNSVRIEDGKLFQVKEEGGDCDPNSATFCLVFIQCEADYVMGLYVFKVSLLSEILQLVDADQSLYDAHRSLYMACEIDTGGGSFDRDSPNLSKKPDLPRPSYKTFVEVNVVEKRFIRLGSDLGFDPLTIHNAFFY